MTGATGATGTTGTTGTADATGPVSTAGSTGAHRRHGPAGWSLRTRLLALLLALLAVMSAVIVFVTAVALRGVLIQQLDDRLEEASRRWGPTSQSGPVLLPGYGIAGPGGAGTPGLTQPRPARTADERVNDFLDFRGQPPGALGAVFELRDPDTAAQGSAREALRGAPPPGAAAPDLTSLIENAAVAVIDSDGGVQPLTGVDAAVVAQIPLDGQEHTRAIADRGDYRLVAHFDPNGQTVLVTGVPMNEVSATLTEVGIAGAIVAALGVLAAGIAGAAIIRVTLRPLSRVAATASRVAELPLDRGAVDLMAVAPDVDTDPRTEVGQVGAALNRMLGHIGAAFSARHASETRMRQFLADASHELRTPLAAISGYAELTRRTRGTVPPDVAYAMGRVESESARMTALVSDLLLLARLDSGRPLVREAVDLSRLVVDAVSDAHVAAPEHRFELDLPSMPVTVAGDPARLHQVLANLLANARTHTPPGSRVTARLTVEPGPSAPGPSAPASSASGPSASTPSAPAANEPGADRPSAVLSVIDDGPGIPDALLPKVFERFARGDSSRSRAAGSTGLGLSIVAAVVEAHHGRVSAASRPGRTAFTVVLPLDTPDPSALDPGAPDPPDTVDSCPPDAPDPAVTAAETSPRGGTASGSHSRSVSGSPA
nr:HAMP domain-containing sensor histidine kinase [Parafrankia discariae]